MTTPRVPLPRQYPRETADCRVFLRSWRNVWSQFDRGLDDCRLKPTTPRIHRLRVTCRRLLAHLELAEELDPGAQRRTRRKIRRVLEITAPLRDAQVQRRLFESLDLAARDPAARRRLRRRERRRARKVRAKFAGREARLRHLGAETPLPSRARLRLGFSSAARQVMLRARRRLRDRLREARGPRGRHRARMAVKRFRYTLEAVAHRTGNGDLGRLRRAQSAMGDLRDFELFVGRLQRIGLRSRRTSAWLKSHRSRLQSRSLQLRAAADRTARPWASRHA